MLASKKSHYNPTPLLLLLLILLGLGCPKQNEELWGASFDSAEESGLQDDTVSDGKEPSTETTNHTDGGTGETDNGSDTTDTGESGIKFDVSSEGEWDGCSEVEILLVLDNSKSMVEENQALGQGLPILIENILTLNPYLGYRTGVMTLDGFQDGCQAWCGDNSSCNIINGILGTQLCQELDGQGNGKTCDSMLGALVDSPILYALPNNINTAYIHPCNFLGGQRFIDSDYTPTVLELTQQTQCAANVGLNGSGHERPLRTLQASLGYWMNHQAWFQGPPPACNQGFFQEDSLLVVIVVTDEDENELVYGPFGDDKIQALQEDLTDMKGGSPENIVFVAFVYNYDDMNMQLILNPDCDPNLAVRGRKVVKTASGFPNRHCNSVQGDLEAALPAIAPAIFKACYNFIPAG